MHYLSKKCSLGAQDAIGKTNIGFVTCDAYAKYCENRIERNIGFLIWDVYQKSFRNPRADEHRVCNLTVVS